MLLITGAGRCGTSVLARFCQNVGYLVGGGWSSAINAGMEDPAVTEVNDRLRNGSGRERDRRFIREFSRLVVKDPRFSQPGVIETWVACRSDLKVLVLLRESKHLYASRAANPEQFEAGLGKNWDAIMHSFWITLARLNVPYRTLAFPDFLDDFRAVHMLLTEFGDLTVDYKRGLTVWRSLIDSAKVHWR